MSSLKVALCGAVVLSLAGCLDLSNEGTFEEQSGLIRQCAAELGVSADSAVVKNNGVLLGYDLEVIASSNIPAETAAQLNACKMAKVAALAGTPAQSVPADASAPAPAPQPVGRCAPGVGIMVQGDGYCVGNL